jgi:hypothetical protein
MSHIYDQKFFKWVTRTACTSARIMLPIVRQAVDTQSVVDIGCGQGGWLSIWNEMGLLDVCGHDGSYVDTTSLLIASERFIACNLERPLPVGRRFGLAQCLEVAEHLPPSAAEGLVDSLCKFSDVVLFSAAQPGQGGERHINERRPSYWAQLFLNRGYFPFDCVRPHLADKKSVSPWYRYNPIIFANPEGMRRLSSAARALQCSNMADLDSAGDLAWRFRLLLLRPLPVRVVSWLSRLHYRLAMVLPLLHNWRITYSDDNA